MLECPTHSCYYEGEVCCLTALKLAILFQQVYESEEFYSLADKYGIMIWQDFMFACALYPTNDDFISNVRSEVEHQVSRNKFLKKLFSIGETSFLKTNILKKIYNSRTYFIYAKYCNCLFHISFLE